MVKMDVDPAGEDLEAYALRRWGAGSAERWRAQLRRAGLPEGAKFEDWRTLPNSLLAHQLLAVASDMGLGEQANNLLFERTYEEGANVSSLDEILGIGEALGIRAGRLADLLTLNGDANPLRHNVLERDLAAKQRLQIGAAPHFIVAAGPGSRTKYSLSGAQHTKVLLGAMERVAAEEALAEAFAASRYGELVASVRPRAAHAPSFLMA